MTIFVADSRPKVSMEKQNNSENGAKYSAKMECIMRVTLSDGTVIERKDEVPGGVPDRGEMDFSNIEGVLRSFDGYERSSIETCRKTLQEFTDEYMSELSKKEPEEGEVERKVELECEAGRISVFLYGDAFSFLRPCERIYGLSFCDMLLTLSAKMGYDATTDAMNRFLHRDGDNRLRTKTIQELVRRLGEKIDAAYGKVTDEILCLYNVSGQTGIPTEESTLPQSVRHPVLESQAAKERVDEIARQYNDRHETQWQIPQSCLDVLPEAPGGRQVYVYIDDVLVKHQKDSRAPGSKRDGRFVSDTVICIQEAGRKYHITATSMQEAFRRLLAFLLSNHLMEDRQLIFISDGATAIKDSIEAHFGFRDYKLYLDWYHLDKKCYQFLSSGLKTGKAVKEDKDRIGHELASLLWVGNCDAALKYISKIDEKLVKYRKALDELVNYITRKSENIPCYAIRNGLGLHNSSNPVEKANDLIVAQRQKNNGMSWSKRGSGALAAITAAERNGERNNIIIGKRPQFALAA